ncbi:MAG: MBL fold metallo-hydrolase, partial [Betaproteobacteria bacterium]
MPRLLRNLLALTATALLAFAPLSPAMAEAPAVKTQVPGYYRMQLGKFEVTALFDGALELETKLLKNTNEIELRKLLARMFVGNPKMQTAVNAYLINTGSN